MKKILLSIFFAFCFFASFGQNILNRSNASVTVADARLQATLNFLAPRFADTTAANTSIGIDSCGALIYTYDVNWYWIRQCNPKRWSQLPTISGSLNTTINIIDSNHISICTINGCDTITITGIIGPITNVTIINNSELRVCGSDILGSELITNGGFTGSATGWTLGTLWAYGSNDIVHSFGSTATSFQGGGLVEGGLYTVALDINGGSVGTVAVALDAGTSQSYGFGAGSVTFTGTWNAGINSKINFAPSNDFDGNITNVSVKQVLPNCDTLQVVPGQNFLDSVIIYARTPLYAENDTTIAIRQAGLQDSGYLSKEGYDSFYNKVDTLYYHNNGATVDTFLYDNGDNFGRAWYVNDVTNGLISGGQVSWSGFGLAYTVEQAIYRINGVRYTSPPTVITLDDADATNPRIDAIGVDSSGNAVYIPGTAEANPVVPQVDNFYQIFLTSILVPALATVAPIDTVIIYNENVVAPTEWTPITNVGTTTDPDNTLNVYRGSKSINVTNINVGDTIIFTKNSTIDLSAYQAVVFFIKLKQVIPAAVATQIRAQWQNGSVNVGGIINVPIDKNNIVTYQAISIPLSIFNFSSTIVTKFKLSYSSGNATVNQGFFIDFVYLQNGVTPTTPPDATQIVAYNGLTHFKNNNIDSIRLGGTLTQTPTTIATGINTLVVSTATAAINPFSVTSTTGTAISTSATTGRAINASSAGATETVNVSNSSSGIALIATGTSNGGVSGRSNGGVGVNGTSTLSLAGEFVVDPSSTNTVIETIRTARTTSGTATAGIGTYIGNFIENGSGVLTEGARVATALTTVTNGSEVSSYSISLRNAAPIAQRFLLSGNGALRLNAYGAGTFTGTATRNLAVDVNGNVIEVSPAGGISANNGLNISSGSNVQLGGALTIATTEIDLSSNVFKMTSGADDRFVIDPDAVNGYIQLHGEDGTGYTDVILYAQSGPDYQFQLATSNGAGSTASVIGAAITQTISLTGQLVLQNQFTPANSTDNTYPNATVSFDNSFLYYRTSTGTWKKIALAAF